MKPTTSTICLLLCTAVISGCTNLEAELSELDIKSLTEAKVPGYPNSSASESCTNHDDISGNKSANIPVIITKLSISPDLADDLNAEHVDGCNNLVGANVFCLFDAQEYKEIGVQTSLSSMRLYVDGLAKTSAPSQKVNAALTHWGFVDEHDKQHETYRANDLATNKKILADAIESEIGNRAVSCRIEYIIIGRNKSNDFLLDFGWMISELRK